MILQIPVDSLLLTEKTAVYTSVYIDIIGEK